MNKRGAYFFVLDALIGGSIFLISVVVILGSFLNTADTRQTFLFAEDIMGVLLNTKIIELKEDFIVTLYDRGDITDIEKNLFDQIAELYYLNKTESAHNLSQIVIDSVLPEQFGARLMMINETDNYVIYNRSVRTINTSRVFLTSKKITFYSLNQTKQLGPDIMELAIWN